MPSAEQNRPAAKGRSADIPRTTVLFSPAASLLKRRTEAAHTPVSRLGKMFNTTFFPLQSARDTSASSPLTRVKSGAVAPTAGRLPEVCTELPLNVDRKSTRL